MGHVGRSTDGSPTSHWNAPQNAGDKATVEEPVMRQLRHRRPALAAAALLVIGAWPVTPARADTTIVVDSFQQGLGAAGCTLEEAILAANQDATTVRFDPGPPHPMTDVDTGCTAGSGQDVIVLRAGVYTMAHPLRDVRSHLGAAALPIIESAITIEGAGAVLQRKPDAAEDFRLFSVGPTGDFDLREVHVRGFTTSGGDGSDGGGGGMGAGGAIFVDDGALRVQWSTFEANVATGGDGDDMSSGSGGGGGGGIGGDGGFGAVGGGGGGGSRGNGATSVGASGGGGGGTLTDGGFTSVSNTTVGGYLCGGAGNDIFLGGGADGSNGDCPGGGGGGGAQGVILTGDGGDGNFGGGGGGGAEPDGNGGDGFLGGGGGAAGTSRDSDGGSGGGGGFGGGGGAGPDGPGEGGTFGGHAANLAGGGGAGLGGAIFGYRANIIVSNSTFTGNAAVRGLAGGNGAGNGADAGGAIFAVGGSLSVTNSTIAGNQTTGDGAGITVYQPVSNETTIFHLDNTIVAGNNGRDECFVLRTVNASGTNNLVIHHANDNRTPCPGITLRDDPQLGGLQLNAPGRTPTMAIGPTSPAIDAGNPDAAPLDDQRGVARPQGAGPDIGAFELDGAGPPPHDTTAPTAAPTAAPAANSHGWNQGSVTVTWHWADDPGGSGLDQSACPPSSTSTGTGPGLRVTGTCRDLEGNVGSAAVTVNVDPTAPTAAPAAAPVANGAGWNQSAVTFTWHWADNSGGSGIDPTACPPSSTSTGEGLGLQVSGSCHDLAGNTGSATATVNVDLTAPGVTCSATPVYTIGGDHGTNVTATVTDGLSRPVASLVSADVTAGDVAAAGVGSKSLTGADLAGNQTTVQCPFVVKYNFLGFLQPIPQTTVKRGSTIPVKFRLGDAGGATLADADSAAMAAACLVEVTFDGAAQGCATYNPVSNTFQLDVKTAKNVAVGRHFVGIRVRVAAGDVVNTDQLAIAVTK